MTTNFVTTSSVTTVVSTSVSSIREQAAALAQRQRTTDDAIVASYREILSLAQHALEMGARSAAPLLCIGPIHQQLMKVEQLITSYPRK